MYSNGDTGDRGVNVVRNIKARRAVSTGTTTWRLEADDVVLLNSRESQSIPHGLSIFVKKGGPGGVFECQEIGVTRMAYGDTSQVSQRFKGTHSLVWGFRFSDSKCHIA